MSSPRRAHARGVLITAGLAGVALTGGAVFVTASPAGAEPVYMADDLRLIGPVDLARDALSALQRGDVGNYAILRKRLATLIAPQVGVDAWHLDTVWATADMRRMSAVLAALTQLGVPYRRLGDTPGESFDCSGLTSWAWSQGGLALPHQSGRQIRGVAATELAFVRPGDLLYYPGHVMLALGVGGAMVHAPNSGNVVEVRMLSERQQSRLRVGDPLA